MPDEQEVDLFAEEEIPELETETEEEEETPNEETDSSEESDEESEEESETEDDSAKETTHPFDRPTVAQIKEAFPGIFKKFPGLQDMYFREKEYTKLFTTIDEAKEAASNNEAFVNIQTDIMQGTGEQFFSALKEIDGLNKFSGGLLSTLARVDKNAFFAAANPLVEDVARKMHEKGVASGNDNLKNAALFLAEFFFNDEDYATGKKTSFAAPTDDATKVSKEREEFENERRMESLNKTESSCKKKLVSAIEGDGKFDPDGVLSPFVKNAIMDKIFIELDRQLSADKSHMRHMESLWANAKRGGYRDLSSIESAYLARAKGLITSLRSKYLSEAMGKKAAIAKGQKAKLQSIVERKNTGASGAPSKGGFGKGKIDYSKTSDDDILNGKITYRS